ncbi:MAG: STN domain-containing protein [Planctomycetia bacterium]|nr:STN domain-containing protein [Planctomycetia bacterium]
MRTTAVTAAFGLLLLTAFTVGGFEKRLPGGEAAPMPLVVTGPVDADIERMIKDLGSDDWRTREKAGRDLEAKGERALPAMRKALLATDDPEVQRRLVILVRKMDHARLVEPKKITLSAKDMTAQQIFAEIAKQTGYHIDFSGGNEGKYSFEFVNTPFWKALDTVANAAGFNVYSDYSEQTVRVYGGDEVMNPYVSYAGPFRFLATNINTNRSVQLANISKRGGNQRNSESMNLSFQIQSEPKNPMLGYSQPELLEAKDEFGGSLLPPQNNRDDYGYRSSRYMNQGYRGHNLYASLYLIRADRSATTIKSLKGRVCIVLLSGTTPELIVTDPLKVKKKSFVGRTTEIELTSVDEDANQKGCYMVSLTAKKVGQFDPNRGDDYNWSSTLWQKMELTDDKGNKYFTYGPQSINYGPGTVTMSLLFTPDDRRTGRPVPVKQGPPARFALNEWLTITHEVTFEFKDIPLP